jgi:hypothetical protein
MIQTALQGRLGHTIYLLEVISVSKQRRWADVRKILEQDLLCDSLKGRLR